MPEIKEYQTQTDVGGPVGGRQATGEDFGANVGAAGAQFGAALNEGGKILQRRQEQAEISDLHAKLSRAHADATSDWQSRLNGSKGDDPDLAKNFLSDFDDDMDDIGGDIKTRAGQNYFNKAKELIRGQLSVNAVHGQAELAGRAAADDVQQSLDSSTSTVMQSPNDFAVTQKTQSNFVDSLVKAGTLPALKGEELKADMNSKLAKATIEGWTNLGPDGPGIAKKKLDNGTYDSYLNSNDKEFLYAKIHQQENANRIEQERLDKAARDAYAAKQDEVGGQLQEKLRAGTLSANDIKDSILENFGGGGSKEWFYKQLDNVNKEGDRWSSDKHVVAELLRRTDLPPGDPQRIKDPKEYMAYVGTADKGNINMTDLEKLTRHYEKGTPQRLDEAKEWADFRQEKWNEIAKPDPVTKLPSTPELADRANQVRMALREQELKYRQQGVSAADALNPKSPNYVGNKVRFSAPTMMDRINSLVKGIGSGTNNVPAQPKTSASPQVGEVRGGYRFNGGNWKDQKNWSKQ